jgi:predicted AAA+ superfamily ATPase
MFSGELSTLLSGRYVEIEVFPLSLIEYAMFHDKPVSSQLFEEYLKYG